MHLAVGFENGEIEIRQHRSGKQTHKVRLPKMSNGKYPSVSKLFYYDFRMSG